LSFVNQVKNRRRTIFDSRAKNILANVCNISDSSKLKFQVLETTYKDTQGHYYCGRSILVLCDFFVFTARCYASAVLAMALCLSVCPSQVGVLLKRLNVGSHKQHRTIPGTLVFECQRYPRNSTGITPCGGAKYRWGGSKSATFDK